ncbi:acyl-CoA N-acyltransferase [Lipomyces doorenjongii]
MCDPDFYIESPRLYISYFLPTCPKHCSFLVQLYNSPLFISAEGKTGVYNELQAQERIQKRFVAEHERNGYGTYLVSLKTIPTTSFDESQPIGSVSLSKGDSKDSYSAPDLGFSIVPEMNGNGYATESGRALLDYAKTELGVTEVLGFFDPNNARSRRVMEKIGLEDRGVRKLAAFGGVEGAVYALPGMKDLIKYGIE